MGSNVPKRTIYGRYKLKPSIIWLVYCCFTNINYPQIIQVIRPFYSSTILVLKPGVLGATLRRRIQPELARTQAGWKPVAASFELHQGTSCNAIYHRFSIFFNFQLKNRVRCTRVNHPQVPKHQPGWGCCYQSSQAGVYHGIPTLSQCRCTTIPIGDGLSLGMAHPAPVKGAQMPHPLSAECGSPCASVQVGSNGAEMWADTYMIPSGND